MIAVIGSYWRALRRCIETKKAAPGKTAMRGWERQIGFMQTSHASNLSQSLLFVKRCAFPPSIIPAALFFHLIVRVIPALARTKFRPVNPRLKLPPTYHAAPFHALILPYSGYAKSRIPKSIDNPSFPSIIILAFVTIFMVIYGCPTVGQKERMKMKKQTKNVVVLEREDLSAHGLDLGIWEALTEGLPANTEQVEVLVIGKFA